MTNKDFWESIDKIIDEGFSPDGLKILEIYANKFIAGQLVYQRFSSFELRQKAVSKENSNEQRRKLRE